MQDTNKLQDTRYKQFGYWLLYPCILYRIQNTEYEIRDAGIRKENNQSK